MINLLILVMRDYLSKRKRKRSNETESLFVFWYVFVEAVADASKAIELDPSMAKAYLRKGLVCEFVCLLLDLIFSF